MFRISPPDHKGETRKTGLGTAGRMGGLARALMLPATGRPEGFTKSCVTPSRPASEVD